MVLNKYGAVFEEPKGLPSQQQHDHHIPLKLRSAPVSQRPYRYPMVQKAEIERVIKDMLSCSLVVLSSIIVPLLDPQFC